MQFTDQPGQIEFKPYFELNEADEKSKRVFAEFQPKNNIKPDYTKNIYILFFKDGTSNKVESETASSAALSNADKQVLRIQREDVSRIVDTHKLI